MSDKEFWTTSYNDHKARFEILVRIGEHAEAAEVEKMMNRAKERLSHAQ